MGTNDGLEPRYAVSELSLPANTFREDVEQIGASTATGIGLWEGKLTDVSDADARAMLADNGLTPTLCMPAVWSIFPNSRFADPVDTSARVDLICESVRHLAVFEPIAVMITPGTATGDDHATSRRLMVDALKRIADVGAESGTRISLEPIRASNNGFVSSLADGTAYVDEVGSDNLGLALDIWHLWDEPGLLDVIAARTDLIDGVQVDDWRDPTRVQSDRVLPGDGISDVSGIMAALIRAGFRGWYELELMSDLSLPDSLWALPTTEFLKRADTSFEKVWREAVSAAGSDG